MPRGMSNPGPFPSLSPLELEVEQLDSRKSDTAQVHVEREVLGDDGHARLQLGRRHER